MEKRTLNISFSKSGSGSIATRLSVPKSWLDKIEVSPEDRKIDLIFDEEKKEMILRKHKK